MLYCKALIKEIALMSIMREPNASGLWWFWIDLDYFWIFWILQYDSNSIDWVYDDIIHTITPGHTVQQSCQSWITNGVSTSINHWVQSYDTCASNIHEPLLLTHCLACYSASMGTHRLIRTSGLLIEDVEIAILGVYMHMKLSIDSILFFYHVRHWCCWFSVSRHRGTL